MFAKTKLIMKRSIITIVAAAAALILGSTAASAQNQEFDWAAFGRYAKDNAALTVRPKAVFMGDSITDAWPFQDPELFKANNFVGRGISGQTTEQMVVRFRKDVIALKPKYVVIMAGTNDVALNNGKIANDDTAGNIISMCEIAKANGIKPVICTITPCSAYRWRPQVKDAAAQIDNINAILKEYAKSHKIKFVDYNTPLRNAEGGLDIPALSGDGCHPNLACYKKREEIVLKALK